jgi:hypothetical protein
MCFSLFLGYYGVSGWAGDFLIDDSTLVSRARVSDDGCFSITDDKGKAECWLDERSLLLLFRGNARAC